MKQELRHHQWSYLVLILFLGLVSFLFLAAWPDIIYQRYLVLLISVFYFFWGVIKELKSETLTKRVILEYFSIAALAGSLLFLITV